MSGKQTILFVLLLFVKAPGSGAQSGLDTRSLKDIFQEPVLPGIRPSFSGFSPDLAEIYFSWNDSSYYETGLYKTDLAGNDMIIAQQTDNSDLRTIYFPEYADTFVKPGESARGIPVTTFTAIELDSIAIDTLRHGRFRRSVSASWSGRYLAIDHADDALSHRQIAVIDFETGSETVVFEDSTKGWFSGRNMEFAPESDLLMFQSEKDNWNHIYTVNPDGSDLKQHTSGRYDIPGAEWLGDSSIIYAST